MFALCYSIFSFICMFCRSLFVLLCFLFWSLVCSSSSIYGFWLPLWYLQTLLVLEKIKTTRLIKILFVLVNWNNSMWVKVCSTREHYLDTHPTSLCSYSLSCVVSGEGANANSIVVDLTRPGLWRRVYHTQCELANYYTTDVVPTKYKIRSTAICEQDIL